MVQKKAKEIKLHLGCGNRIIPGFINIDQSKYKHIDYNISVTDLSIFKNNSVDMIYASHILEYFDLNETYKVLREWRRVLKKNGVALLLFPIIDAWKKTYRNKNINNRADRELHFLQWDHLHLYGKDIEEKLSGDGFELKRIIPFGEECVKFGISKGESLFVLKKIF